MADKFISENCGELMAAELLRINIDSLGNEIVKKLSRRKVYFSYVLNKFKALI